LASARREDFDAVKKNIQEELFKIEAEISALDLERSTMEELIQQAKVQAVNLREVWLTGNVNQRQQLARNFFPEGLYFSRKLKFFEPANYEIFGLSW
jgi:hypothetical protein